MRHNRGSNFFYRILLRARSSFHTFTIIWMVGIINAVNMMDGLDGLSGGICLIILSSIAVQQPSNILVNLLIPGLLGGLVIFLFYNWYPAKFSWVTLALSSLDII